jgi:RNA polymerase sigma factor (sigma-70 family)
MVGNNERGAVLQSIQTLYDMGSLGGLSDGALLGLFADRRNETAESAFATLVERHGAMVLRVCRSLLRDEHDAQDAFQATFLILVRRAGAIRKRESVGSWLYGVSLRVSACARIAAARRRRHERLAAQTAPERLGDESGSRELSAIIHEELHRLPERYRAAVVLCYLEGLTCEAAARRLGWPVGTVKSRLARGRERLAHRLVRRGLGSDEPLSSHSSAISLVPASLASGTVQAMLRFGAGRSPVDIVSATALSWTYCTLRSMQMARLVMITAAFFGSLPALGALVLAAQKQELTAPSGPAKTAARDREPGQAIVPDRKAELTTVRVVNPKGEVVPNVEVDVFESTLNSEVRKYRTGDDGRCRILVDVHAQVTELHARTDDRALGWASISRPAQPPKGTDQDPVEIILLPRNHLVEGSIRNTAGKPIAGVQVRVRQLQHEANGMAIGDRGEQEEPILGSAVTDGTGRYTMSLPENTLAILAARHPRYFGPLFLCPGGEGTIAPVILEDSGGIAGTVIDSITEKPVENVRVRAQLIEVSALRPFRPGPPQGGEWGEASTEARGRFVIRGLAPGVFNVLFMDSWRGKKFTARAVEGVRVKAGDDARADLVLIEGRRLYGTVTDFPTEKPMADIWVRSYNSARPRSGDACLDVNTDDRGYYELFVPPGAAYVFVGMPGTVTREHHRYLTVVADSDPEPIHFQKAREVTADFLEKSPTPIEFEARIRVRTDANNGPPRKERDLTGRIFDQHGLPVTGARVSYNMEKFVSGATDRLGLFRLKGLPPGPFALVVDKSGYTVGWATIPPEAQKVELTLPSRPDSPE